ncbi:hypothetical protein C8R47DRAFT_1280556 [Mycena vitilis]|nr:hypothetical protein C8R47DRAFT_1280556 [Mycena vitilis]
MPTSARTMAIMNLSWAIALVLDLLTIGAVIASLIIHKNYRDWYIIVFIILVFCTIVAALSTRGWWRTHQAQIRAAIPYYASPPPAPAR